MKIKRPLVLTRENTVNVVVIFQPTHVFAPVFRCSSNVYFCHFLKFLSVLKVTSDWLVGVMNTKEEWKYAAMDFGAPFVMEDTGTPEMQLLFAHTLDIKMPVRQNYEL